MSAFDYDIIATGSKGNAVLLHVNPSNGAKFDILIDIGLPYKRVAKALDTASFVFISHRHFDHIVPSTYNKLTLEHPRTTIVTNNETKQFILYKGFKEPHIILPTEQSGYLGDLKVTAFDNYHGVECNGWIFELDGEVLLYATDLSQTIEYEYYLRENKLKVDYLLLEGNYDINVFKYYVSLKGDSMLDLFSNGSSRHLPVQNWEEFKDEFTHENSRIEMLHTSSTYGSIEGLLAKMNDERQRLNEKTGTNYRLMTLEDYKKWSELNGI